MHLLTDPHHPPCYYYFNPFSTSPSQPPLLNLHLLFQTGNRHNVHFGLRGGVFFVGYVDGTAEDNPLNENNHVTTPFDALVGGVGWLVRNGESYIVESLSPTGDNEDVTGLGLGSGSASGQGLGPGSASGQGLGPGSGLPTEQGLPKMTVVEDDDRDVLVERLSTTLMGHTVIGHDKVPTLTLTLTLTLILTLALTLTLTLLDSTAKGYSHLLLCCVTTIS